MSYHIILHIKYYELISPNSNEASGWLSQDDLSCMRLLFVCLTQADNTRGSVTNEKIRIRVLLRLTEGKKPTPAHHQEAPSTSTSGTN